MLNIKTFIGNLWGETTTQLLGFFVALETILAIPAVQTALGGFSWFPYAVAGVAVALMLLRRTAPPPPNVTLQPGDAATVSSDNKTIIVSKADELPAAVISKAATLPDVA